MSQNFTDLNVGKLTKQLTAGKINCNLIKTIQNTIIFQIKSGKLNWIKFGFSIQYIQPFDESQIIIKSGN